MEIEKVIWEGSTQLAPVPAVLVGCGGANGYKNNILTIAWAGIVNSQKPMLSVSIRKERYSHDIIVENQEFTVNIPTASMVKKVDWCGVVSGRKFDKFKECGFTAVKGSKVAAPIVAECPMSLECKVFKMLELGTHDMFIGEIVAVQISKDFILDNKLDLSKDGLLGYCHGAYYNIGEMLGTYGFSVKK